MSLGKPGQSGVTRVGHLGEVELAAEVGVLGEGGLAADVGVLGEGRLAAEVGGRT